MQFPDPQAALNHAMELHRQQRTAEADSLYRQLYASFPQAIDLVHLIGLTTFELGRHVEGIAMLQESLRHRPLVAHYHANYGSKLTELRRPTKPSPLSPAPSSSNPSQPGITTIWATRICRPNAGRKPSPPTARPSR